MRRITEINKLENEALLINQEKTNKLIMRYYALINLNNRFLSEENYIEELKEIIKGDKKK